MGRRPRRPDNAEITITATVQARQLRFGEVPQTSTEFSGMPGHESASGSDRVHLPQHVEKDVTYRHVRVDYRLASALRYLAEANGSGLSVCFGAIDAIWPRRNISCARRTGVPPAA